MSAQKEDYLYLSSLLRAREKNMLTRDRAERMLDAPGFEDCAKLLTDSGYEDMSQMNIKQIEDALAARRAALFRELESLVPDTAALDLFRMKYDYHNIKVLIKSAAMEQEDSALLSESGRIPSETILRCFRDDRLRDLPGAIGAAAEEARNLLSRSANPQLSDFLLDKAYFAELQEKAEALNSDFARGYVRILADATNLRSACAFSAWGRTSATCVRPWSPAAASVKSASSAASPVRGSRPSLPARPLQRLPSWAPMRCRAAR